MRNHSRAEIDRLGSRLSREPTDEDLRLYLDYAKGFEDALRAVVAVVRDSAERLPPQFREVGSRIKATDSVVGKLRRKEASLGDMQDIAGCRLTVPDLFDLEVVRDELEEQLNVR